MSFDMFEIDPLQLYFGDDYVINDKIKVKQPTIKGYAVSITQSVVLGNYTMYLSELLESPQSRSATAWIVKSGANA